MSIQRFFDITPTTNTGLGATLVFHYDESELNGIDENTLVLFRSPDGGTTWTSQGGILDAAGNTLTLAGIDAFSRWTAADINDPLPVELVSFEAIADGQELVLRWETASETNNAGFEVQQRAREGAPAPLAAHAAASTEEAAWNRVAFVEGRGTTAEPQQYTYRLDRLAADRYTFRLKQVDFEGTFAYSPEVEVTIELARAFVLSSVYPNPVHGQAHITLAVQREQPVRMELYDELGRRVARLHDGVLSAHKTYRFRFDSEGLPAGVYFLVASGSHFRDTRSLILIR